jgi:hypothetical protein
LGNPRGDGRTTSSCLRATRQALELELHAEKSLAPIRFAIIGSGAIASNHAKAMAAVPEANLVAVWSRSSEQCEKIVAKLGVEFISGARSPRGAGGHRCGCHCDPSGMNGMSAMPF